MAELRRAEPADYDRVIEVLDDWWGGRSMRAMLPRLFFDHFHETSLVAEEDGRLVGFLCGLHPPGKALAYIHFVGVRPTLPVRLGSG